MVMEEYVSQRAALKDELAQATDGVHLTFDLCTPANYIALLSSIRAFPTLTYLLAISGQLAQ